MSGALWHERIFSLGGIGVRASVRILGCSVVSARPPSIFSITQILLYSCIVVVKVSSPLCSVNCGRFRN